MKKISYETHFRSSREDGRHVASLAAYMEKLRNMQPTLALPGTLTPESFATWKMQVQEKYRELLLLPEFSEQPDPVKLSCTKREGYTVEKWEFYPDDYTVVPFLVLIPDGASRENPVPGVLCMPGSTFSKEFLAGEPLLEPSNCRLDKYPERNKMALYMVQNGMVAFAFDNIATAECGLVVEDNSKDYYNSYSRSEMCYGYLAGGTCYPGMTTFNMLCFLKHIHMFECVDLNRLAISGHSLGTYAALSLGIFCDEIKAVVFNDLLDDFRIRFVSTTESEEGNMRLNPGNWHIVPGRWQYFDFPDLCAAIAPKYLAINEGGADYNLNVVKRAYEVLDSQDKLQITHYPKYQNKDARNHYEQPPLYGLSEQLYFDHANCDAPDHSFRKEPSIRLLKKCFGMD